VRERKDKYKPKDSSLLNYFDAALEKLEQDVLTARQKICLAREYQRYCHSFRNRKNAFVVEIRRQMGLELRKLGFTVVDIGAVIFRDHSNVSNLLSPYYTPNNDIAEIVKENLEQWMSDKVYPETVNKTKYDKEFGKAVTVSNTYRLVNTLSKTRIAKTETF